jgi:hypothetical protein
MSARRGSDSRLQRRSALRTDYVSPRTVASRTTAGSRQPLLVHARKSSQMGGGALQRRFFSHGGLTPPALGFVCGSRCRCGLTADESVSFSHGWLTPAALVSGCERLPAKNDFCDAQTHIRPRAAGVSPPWVALRRADNAQRVTSGE